MLTEAARARLVKLLNLTASDSDHEALSAIRLINTIIKKENVTWEIVIARSGPAPTVQPQSRPQPQQARPQRDDIYKADEAFHHIFSGFGSFASGAGARSWIVDKKVVEALFGEAFNRGYIYTEQENEVLKVFHHFWTTNGRLSDKQFQALRLLVERERKRANSSSRF